MDRRTLSIAPGITLDARRAVWLAEPRALVLADLHLGYAWAQRQSGNLLPLGPAGEEADLLAALVADYAPERVVLLGDVVHRALALPGLREEICRLMSALAGVPEVEIVLGNHDRALPALLASCDLQIRASRELQLGPFLLRHGDDAAAREPGKDGWQLIGHEHPAISLGDGVTALKCPCFLIAESLIILPASSRWAAGSDVRSGRWMSPAAQAAEFHTAVASLADKLVPIRLAGGTRSPVGTPAIPLTTTR